MTKFLDYNGLSYFWEKIKAWVPFLSKKSQSIPFGQVDSTSTSTVFTATVDGITELRDGVCCYLRNGVVSSASGFTININGLGAKPVYGTMAAATRSTTLFHVNYTLLFVYNSSRVEGGCWDAYYGYYSDSNNLGIYIRTDSMSMPVSDYTGRYRLLFTSADGTHFVPSTTSTSSNTTSLRDVNQRPIDPFGSIIMYNTTTALNAESRPSPSALTTQYAFSLGYAFNRTGAALTLTPWVPVYVKCAPQSNGSAIIDADTPYVQSLPSTDDGKIYIFLGVAYTATQIDFVYNHPIYYYKDGAIREWTNASETDVSGKADKVVGATNGHLAGLDATGNLTDSGHSASDFALNSQVTTKIVVDDIMNIPPRTVDNLQVGDIVAEHIDNGDGESWVEDTYKEYVVSDRYEQSDEGVYSGSLSLDRIDSGIEVLLIRIIYSRYAEEDWGCTTQKYVLSGIDTNAFPNNNKYTIFAEYNASYLMNFPLTGNVSIIASSGRDIFYLSPIFFRFSFDTGNTVPNVTWPSQISYWKGGSAPTLQPNTHYEIVAYGRGLGGNSFSAFAECLSTADDTVDISGKADKVQNATNGNFAGLDSNGNLTDSGIAPSSLATKSDISGKEDTSNKVSTISGNETNTTKYPNTKAVADALGKWGVISQTQTWSGTGTQPRTYVMSNLVYGTIPQANIDLFESAGATFNATSGYFELNELTDISYEEMEAIYSSTAGLVHIRSSHVNVLTNYSHRTTLGHKATSSFQTNLQYMCYNSKLVNIKFLGTAYSTQSNVTGAFQGSSRLRKVIGTILLGTGTGSLSPCSGCYSLEHLYIKDLKGSLTIKDSSLFELDSVVYIVQNAANTSAITITLHADALARCTADTTEYEYNDNTYTGIVALATAKNITLASA